VALSCWKIENLLEICSITNRNYCNCIMLRLILLTNLDSVIDKYHIGVMSTICDSPTDAISDVNCLRRSFVATSFFLVCSARCRLYLFTISTIARNIWMLLSAILILFTTPKEPAIYTRDHWSSYCVYETRQPYFCCVPLGSETCNYDFPSRIFRSM